MTTPVSPATRATMAPLFPLGVSVMVGHVGTRWSQRPKHTSAPVARKRPGPGTAAHATGAATRRWPGARSTAPPAHAARLQAVVGPLGVAEPVDGVPVPDRGMPVLVRLGHAPKPPVQQADD